jgi:hypothetical protein
MGKTSAPGGWAEATTSMLDGGGRIWRAGWERLARNRGMGQKGRALSVPGLGVAPGDTGPSRLCKDYLIG